MNTVITWKLQHGYIKEDGDFIATDGHGIIVTEGFPEPLETRIEVMRDQNGKPAGCHIEIKRNPGSLLMAASIDDISFNEAVDIIESLFDGEYLRYRGN